MKTEKQITLTVDLWTDFPDEGLEIEVRKAMQWMAHRFSPFSDVNDAVKITEIKEL